MADKWDVELIPRLESDIVPNRKITAMSAVLLPLLHDGTVDRDAFDSHLAKYCNRFIAFELGSMLMCGSDYLLGLSQSDISVLKDIMKRLNEWIE